MNIGKKLKELRVARGLTQKELADRSGVTNTVISRLETGRIRDPRISTVERLAEGLDVTLTEFFASVEAEGDQDGAHSIPDALRSVKSELKNRFHVREIGLFGSRARGEATEESDIDILVTYEEGHRDIFNHSRLEVFLEKLLGGNVDLIPKTSVRDEVGRSAQTDLIYV